MPSKNKFDIIRTPLISEKGVSMMEDNKYCFKVAPYANKHEIKDAVEKIFNVSVTKVNTVKYDGKLKRQGIHVGKRPQWKKAIVTLKEGNKIEVFEGA
ncbi:MAG: 50S ribosomal protein L23 [Candidatus Muiribacteriota bacterium]|jgi:large subunit ribosomal protein L23